MTDAHDPIGDREGLLVDLLADLTDDEVDQYIAYWKSRHDVYTERGDGYSAWWCSKHMSAGLADKRRRSE